MVCSGVEERQRVRNRESSAAVAAEMAMGTERSKPLHNFTLPCLRWGNQRHLRCMKVEESSADGEVSAVDRRSPASRFVHASHFAAGGRRRDVADYERKRLGRDFARDSERRTARAPKSKIDGEEDGIEAVREKLTLDLKTAASKMKDAILRKEAATEDERERVSAAPPPGETRPWNLRTRRAACKEPASAAGGAKGVVAVEERSQSYSPLRSDGAAAAKLPRLRASPEKVERPKFSATLSRKEIEEDYEAILGERPPRRPKKRARIVQKQLDSLFPGLWLTEVSEDMYKVAELPETGKR